MTVVEPATFAPVMLRDELRTMNLNEWAQHSLATYYKLETAD